MSRHGHPAHVRTIRLPEIAILVVCLLLGAFAIIFDMSQSRGALVSVETRFSELSESGMQIIPASCPSYPHFTGGLFGTLNECSDGTPNPPSPPPQTPPPPPPVYTCPAGQHLLGAGSSYCICDGTNLPPNSAGQCTQQVCPSGTQFDSATGNCVAVAQCTLSPICSDSTHILNQCTGQTTNCAANGPGWRCVNAVCQAPPPPIASISAVPSLVPPNRTTNVAWSSQNTSSCTVTGNNGDGGVGWSGTTGSHVSSAIASQVIFTLVCDGFDGSTITRQATVNIIPNWEEN